MKFYTLIGLLGLAAVALMVKDLVQGGMDNDVSVTYEVVIENDMSWLSSLRGVSSGQEQVVQVEHEVVVSRQDMNSLGNLNVDVDLELLPDEQLEGFEITIVFERTSTTLSLAAVAILAVSSIMLLFTVFREEEDDNDEEMEDGEEEYSSDDEQDEETETYDAFPRSDLKEALVSKV